MSRRSVRRPDTSVVLETLNIEGLLLSPEWLSGALGARVRAVEVVERLETVATKVRFRVEYEDADSGNSRVDAFCVKAYFNPAMRTRVAAG